MDAQTALRLARETSRFYDRESASFSSSRRAPWKGWERLVDATHLDQRSELTVLDVGCGNLRFEEYLLSLPSLGTLRARCIDGCGALMEDRSPLEASLELQRLDIVETLACGTLSENLGESSYDLCVAFGFFHHLPLPTWREDLLRALIDSAAPGGIIALSLWQFEKDERIIEKARLATERAKTVLGIEVDTDAGDWLLGWQDTLDVFRFCHSFDENEIEGLIAIAREAGAELVTSYRDDGKERNLNRYLVFERLQGRCR